MQRGHHNGIFPRKRPAKAVQNLITLLHGFAGDRAVENYDQSQTSAPSGR